MKHPATTLALAVALLAPAPLAAQTPSKEKPAVGTLPLVTQPSARGRYRVTLNGFEVGRETVDHMLEADGKRDEVFLMAEVWQLDPTGAPTAPRRSLRTVVMGDVNGQSQPPRIRAGSAGAQGGLRTGDRFPSREPWRRTVGPAPDRLPLLLWEGELADGATTVVILPSVWEWDGPDQVLAAWQPYASGRSLAGQSLLWTVQDLPRQLARESAPAVRLMQLLRFETFDFPHEGDNDRPVGVGMYDGRPRAFGPYLVAFNRAAAERALRSAPSDKGPGIVEVRYTDDAPRNGIYTLYLQIERMP